MYKLDSNAAKQAEQFGGKITETGKYIAKITRAEVLTASTGTNGIGFTVIDNSGQEGKFSIYTIKKDGEKLPGYSSVNAMMACLKIRELSEEEIDLEKWDYDQKKLIPTKTKCLKEFMGKSLGFLLRSEEYESMEKGKKTGETKWGMQFYACFQPETELMASEILSSKTIPEQLKKIESKLADKPLKNKPAVSVPKKDIETNDAQSFDDDIPF